MTLLYSVGGIPIMKGPGVVEGFGGPEGVPLSNRWTDAYDIYGPGMFSRVIMDGDGTTQVDRHVYEMSFDGSTVGTHYVAHCVASRACGSDDGEVSVIWDASEDPFSIIHQVGPAFGMDLLSESPYEMGICYNSDVSLGATMYAQDVGRYAMWDSFDYIEHYNVFNDTIQTDRYDLMTQDVHTLTIRKVGGYYSGYWDGVKTFGPEPVPEWALGRDGWGFNIISIIPFNHPMNSARMKGWIWRPYNGPL